MQETVRWNVVVSKETDIALRSYLGSKGMKKGAISKFVEDAVNEAVFHSTVSQMKAHNQGVDPDVLQQIIDGAVTDVRQAKRLRKKP